jgi:hypothetical protein
VGFNTLKRGQVTGYPSVFRHPGESWDDGKGAGISEKGLFAKTSESSPLFRRYSFQS